MAAGDGKGVAWAAGGLGVLLVYSGITGKNALAIGQGLIKGQAPKSVPVTQKITGSTLTGVTTVGTGAGSASGQAIAADALQYQGAGYVWGGAPAQGIGHWDCSSFANWVTGHDLKLPIPGYAAGQYTGNQHGPTTQVWLLWGGLTTVGHQGAQSQPGDLCVWQTHMGIALGGGQMISAQDPANGTQVSGIDGFIPGELLFIRRYAGGSTGGQLA